MPFFLEVRFVVVSFAILGFIVFGLFFRHSFRSGGGRVAHAKAGIGASVLCLLTLQFLACVFPHSRGWPFVGYAMYTNKAHPYDTADSVQLRKILPNGRLAWISAHDFGMAIDSHWQVIRPLMHGNAAVKLGYLRRAQTSSNEMRGLQVIVKRRRLTPNGPIQVATLVPVHFDPEAQ